MTRPSGFTARNERISFLLDVTPSLRLRDVAQELGVTEMTLRRDAAMKEAAFACQGGYIVPHRFVGDYDFDKQMRRAITAKRQAAGYAADLVPADACVFLDTGTTLPHLARALSRVQVRRIVTHCLTVADHLHGRTSAVVEFIGGTLQPRTRSCHPADPVAALSEFDIDMAFLSAGALDAHGVLTCSHDYEVAMKRAALAAATVTWSVMDTSKIGQTRSARFATLSELSGIVTEQGVHPSGEGLPTVSPGAA
ncbi:DeoR/GlpR family DNA-binding transcription regulator [Roseinatronobacter alkalisoli]|uniref:DeoR/GlpR family DNA-binding transcription regulator n=1 Tax=Roseinatronobacter alkalisoli TaxID=3028235 RepID=A0ABT5TCF8_9RHOB|nr:DeoR/GlpR family DNA-binding transcription regulator [Roseinatronobacter sp. HJB301]MDD7972810.1 DeoR/GlpR family DNA-binding transcription regulator [Roseinatronobacter sp. HJB301]